MMQLSVSYKKKHHSYEEHIRDHDTRLDRTFRRMSSWQRLHESHCTTERLLRTTSTLGINFIVLQFRSLRKINRVL